MNWIKLKCKLSQTKTEKKSPRKKGTLFFEKQKPYNEYTKGVFKIILTTLVLF